MRKKQILLYIMIALLILLIVVLTVCLVIGRRKRGNSSTDPNQSYVNPLDVESSDMVKEADGLKEGLEPAQILVLKPEASGTLTVSNQYAVIDYSHTEDGYVMVKFTADTSKRLKSKVQGPDTTYTYNLTPGQWTVFPLSDGNGAYQVNVYENIADNRYALVLSADMSVSLKDEFAPFIRPNQYVNYEDAKATIGTAASLAGSTDDILEKVEIIYDYVVDNIKYDKKKAATVASGYLPDLDAVLAAKEGICFDYAALMTGMLRSLGVPCKLVVGYAGEVYHAWINVWSEKTGWVDGAVFFDGTTWQRMDPTFASGNRKDAEAMEFIGDGTNYTTKYVY